MSNLAAPPCYYARPGARQCCRARVSREDSFRLTSSRSSCGDKAGTVSVAADCSTARQVLQGCTAPLHKQPLAAVDTGQRSRCGLRSRHKRVLCSLVRREGARDSGRGHPAPLERLLLSGVSLCGPEAALAAGPRGTAPHEERLAVVLLWWLLSAARPGAAFGDAVCSSTTFVEVPRVAPACTTDLRTHLLQLWHPCSL